MHVQPPPSPRLLRNSGAGDAYDIVPRMHDGEAMHMPDWPFPLWVLKYKGTMRPRTFGHISGLT